MCHGHFPSKSILHSIHFTSNVIIPWTIQDRLLTTTSLKLICFNAVLNMYIRRAKIVLVYRIYPKIRPEKKWWPASSWLVSSVDRALHRYRRAHGFKSRTELNFFQALFSLLLEYLHLKIQHDLIWSICITHNESLNEKSLEKPKQNKDRRALKWALVSSLNRKTFFILSFVLLEQHNVTVSWLR